MKNLILRYPLTLLVLLFIGFYSCSNVEELDYNSEKIIKKIERTPAIDPNGLNYYFIFLEDGKAYKFGIYENDPDDFLSFEYDNLGNFTKRLEPGFPSPTLFYEGNVLARVVYSNNSYINYLYEENIVTGEHFYYGEINTREVYEFSDNNYTKLLNYKRINTATNTIIRSETFEYDGELLIKSDYYSFNPNTEVFELTRTIELEYDDKKNPYQIGFSQNALITSWMYFYHEVYITDKLVFQMNNNLVRYKFTYHPTNNILLQEREYIYDEFGYPISYLEKRNGEPFKYATFEYY